MKGLPSTSSSALILNSGHVRGANLQGHEPAILVLTYQVHWHFWAEGLLGAGKWEGPFFPKQGPEKHFCRLGFLAQTFLFLWDALYTMVALVFGSEDKINASVLNPTFRKLWSIWKMRNFHPQPLSDDQNAKFLIVLLTLILLLKRTAK